MLFFTSLAFGSEAINPVVYQIKASYIYNFLQFVKFPENNIQEFETIKNGKTRQNLLTQKQHDSSQITVCILGDNHFGSALDVLDGANTPQGHIKIQLLAGEQDKALATSCHVLYIVGSNVELSQEVLSTIDPLRVLTIGESSLFTDSGGYIELFVHNDSIRFRFNKRLLGKTLFKVAPQLLSLGVSS
jgi:hypothetical protein